MQTLVGPADYSILLWGCSDTWVCHTSSSSTLLIYSKIKVQPQPPCKSSPFTTFQLLWTPVSLLDFLRFFSTKEPQWFSNINEILCLVLNPATSYHVQTGPLCRGPCHPQEPGLLLLCPVSHRCLCTGWLTTSLQYLGLQLTTTLYTSNPAPDSLSSISILLTDSIYNYSYLFLFVCLFV